MTCSTGIESDFCSLESSCGNNLVCPTGTVVKQFQSSKHNLNFIIQELVKEEILLLIKLYQKATMDNQDMIGLMYQTKMEVRRESNKNKNNFYFLIWILITSSPWIIDFNFYRYSHEWNDPQWQEGGFPRGSVLVISCDGSCDQIYYE